MAFQSIWYFSDIPEEIVGIIEKDLSENFDSQMGDSRLYGDALNKDKRNSKNAWIPTTHWVSGFLWHYIQRANRENFLYDLRNIDGESLQYTQYNVGQFYSWHNDAGFQTHYKPQSVGNHSEGLASDFLNENIELVRKLSVVMQLSDPDDYEGGDFYIQTGSPDPEKLIKMEQKKGRVLAFPSFMIHGVAPVTKGTRRSIVVWVEGPKFK